MRVLDASVFIREEDTEIDGPLATIPAVREELTGESGFRFDALEGSGMRIHVPNRAAIDRVERTARETGDSGELSETDVRLTASALELDGTLVTDDYAMQNVAERLSIAVETIEHSGIAEEHDWKFQCAGCGRVYDEDPERCPICGSDCSRKRP